MHIKMQNSFDIGDSVICIGMNEDYQDKLVIGEIYTLASIKFTCGEHWFTVLENDEINSYCSDYFKPNEVKLTLRDAQ